MKKAYFVLAGVLIASPLAASRSWDLDAGVLDEWDREDEDRGSPPFSPRAYSESEDVQPSWTSWAFLSEMYYTVSVPLWTIPPFSRLETSRPPLSPEEELLEKLREIYSEGDDVDDSGDEGSGDEISYFTAPNDQILRAQQLED